MRRSLLVLFVLGLALLTGAQRTATWDLWFHLATGREILAQRSTLPLEIFSHTAAGQPWRYKDLIADVILYLGFSRLQFWAFFLLKGLCAAAIALSLFLALSRTRALALVCASGLLLAALQYRIVERPLIFSLALFPWLLALLERARRLLTARALAAPVLLSWLWLQLHREALVALVVLLGFACYLGLAAAARGRLPRLLHITPSWRAVGLAFAAAAAALLLSLINPAGIHTLTSTVSVGESSFYRHYVMDWRALSPQTLVREFPAAALLVVLALAALAVAWWRRVFDLWHAGLVALFLSQTLASSRYLPYLATVSALALLGVLTRLLPQPAPGPREPLLLTLAGVGLLVLVRVASPQPLPLGVGPVPDHYPEAAVRFALAQGLRPRMANAVELGGYVMWAAWPKLQVSLDGRMDTVYTPEQLRRGLGSQASARTFAALRREDGADWVLAANEFGAESHLFLDRDPAWALIYWSEPAAIYVRRDAYPRQAEALRFRFFDRAAPFPSIARAAALVREDPARLPEIEAELRRLVYEGSPRGVLSRSLLALFYHRLGPRLDPSRAAQRDELVAGLLADYPDHPAVLALPELFSGR